MHASLIHLTREDTMLGVCASIGEELGISPLVPRLLFAVALFWNPVAVVVAYLTLGVALAVFRWVFPPQAAAPAEQGRSADVILV